MEEFIFSVDFKVFDAKKVPNVKSHIPVRLERSFLGTSNALINYRNCMMKLSSGNMTLDLNIFNLQRRPDGFSDVNHPTLIGWMMNDTFVWII